MRTIDTPDGKEVAFNWTCPHCGRRQEDSIHPILGPFLALTCGHCDRRIEDIEMLPADAAEFENAIILADSLLDTED